MVKFIALIIFCAQTFGGGDTVRNGGDAVLCRSSEINSFRGYYSLDYLTQYDSNAVLPAVGSLDASMDRIQKGLADKLPELRRDFADFKRGLFNEDNTSLSRLWEKAPFGLKDLKDEDMVTLLPENCREGDKASVAQAVIREPSVISGRPVDTYVYKYVEEVVNDLNATNPLQLSYLVLHEWLWDFSSHVERNRRINNWLHSDRLEKWTREEWKEQLEGIGFVIPGEQPPVYNPEICPVKEEYGVKLGAYAEKVRNKSFGLGTIHARTRLCTDETGCPFHYIDKSKSFAGNFGPQIRVEIKEGQVVVRTAQRGPTHFNCYTSNGKFKCGSFVTVHGFQFIPDLQFKPEVGKDCIRFTAKIVHPKMSGNTQIDEMVLYFPDFNYGE